MPRSCIYFMSSLPPVVHYWPYSTSFHCPIEPATSTDETVLIFIHGVFRERTAGCHDLNHIIINNYITFSVKHNFFLSTKHNFFCVFNFCVIFISTMKRKRISKAIDISAPLHSRIRIFCDANGLKIYCWIEKTLSEALDKKEKENARSYSA